MMETLKNIVNTKPWIIFISFILLSIFSETIIGRVLFIIWLYLFIFWSLELGERLHNKLADKSILNIKRYKYQIYFAIIYLILVFSFSEEGYSITNENFDEYGWKAWVIIPLHLILMFIIVHSIYFLSKCITILRNKKESYFWYILGFWFFPIGIWIIQPKIIEILKQDNFR